MKIEYSLKTNSFFAQAYGTSTYGDQTYSCTPADQACATAPPAANPTPTTESAPNTGFLGMSQDAAIASAGGALLVAIAIAGAVYVVISRIRNKKNRG